MITQRPSAEQSSSEAAHVPRSAMEVPAQACALTAKNSSAAAPGADGVAARLAVAMPMSRFRWRQHLRYLRRGRPRPPGLRRALQTDLQLSHLDPPGSVQCARHCTPIVRVRPQQFLVRPVRGDSVMEQKRHAIGIMQQQRARLVGQ